MICPGCGSENEMAYSVLSNSLVCLEPECGFELEMNGSEAHEVLETEEELVCCYGVKLLLFGLDETLVITGGAGLRALDRACLLLLGLSSPMQGISPSGTRAPAIARGILR